MVAAEIEPIDDLIEPIDDDSPPDVIDSDDDDHDGDNSRWLTVATFWEPTEAHIARLKLESEDIDCMILDENLVATYWFWASAVGGIKLQVRETDFPEAMRLLKNDRPAEQSAEPIYDGQLKCPQCGSEDIYPQRFSRRFAALSMILLCIPIPLLHPHQKCAKCGFEWKPA